MSRGGARLIVEEAVQPGQLLELVMGDAGEPREVRVVWVQSEVDGQIIGVQFLDVDGTIPPPPSSPGAPPPDER